jgi:DtxR family Mn-dependent transcriptional regulator
VTAGAEGDVSAGAARYLEAIFYVGYEEGSVRAGRLAEWLGVSAPTVSEALRRLERDGLLASGPGRTIVFTPAGRRRAGRVVRRHRIVEVWLTEQLGLDWVAADDEAHRISHAFSDEVLERLHSSLGRPRVCPHGNWIPGEPQPPRGEQRLTELPGGGRARVARISEVAEHETPALLGRLHLAGVTPGRVVGVLQVHPDGRRTVQTGDGEETLDERSAAAVWVLDVQRGQGPRSARNGGGAADPSTGRTGS